MVEDEKQLHRNLIRVLSKAALVKSLEAREASEDSVLQATFGLHHWPETPAEGWSRGRPARDLRFLVDWERDSHYAVVCALARGDDGTAMGFPSGHRHG